jgi:predicted CopG family antitoxin
MDIPGILVKTLKISEETHNRLAKLGNIGDTFEDVIIKLLDSYDRNKFEAGSTISGSGDNSQQPNIHDVLESQE